MNDDNQKDGRAVSDYWLERLALGEVSDKQRRRIEAELTAAGDDVDERLAGLRASNEALLEEYPAEMMASHIEARLEERKKVRERDVERALRRDTSPNRWWGGLAVLAAAAAALIVFTMPKPPRVHPGRGTDGSADAVRLKGAQPKLVLWRKAQGKAERLNDGAVAHAGDTLQIQYSAAGQRFGVIASVDGRGAVTLHYPSAPAGKTRLKKSVTALDFGYQLDDAPRFERFFFITSDKPLDSKQILDSLKTLARRHDARDGQPELPTTAHMADFIVEKK